MPKLSNWIRKKFSGAYKSNNDPELSQPALPRGLPVLPPNRQYVLTPSPSCENLLHSDTAKNSFFQRLPLELRRKIYIAAFGGRIIHMDLRFDYPEVRGPAHARLDPENMNPRIPSGMRDWFWWSCVCHRNPVLEGWEDQCRRGASNTTCWLYPGKMPDKCFLGAMGWLLTCRQGVSYVEGLDVLYSTNTVHIGSLALARYIPLLLLPQRLANINSLELVWDLVLFRPLPKPRMEQEKGWPAYYALVNVVGSAFPRLRKLYISIQTGSYIADAPVENIKAWKQKLLDPIDDMVRKLGPQLQHCQIALPLSPNTALMLETESISTCIESGGPEVSPWRRLVIVRQGDESGDELEYWVRRGIDDTLSI